MTLGMEYGATHNYDSMCSKVQFKWVHHRSSCLIKTQIHLNITATMRHSYSLWLFIVPSVLLVLQAHHSLSPLSPWQQRGHAGAYGSSFSLCLPRLRSPGGIYTSLISLLFVQFYSASHYLSNHLSHFLQSSSGQASCTYSACTTSLYQCGRLPSKPTSRHLSYIVKWIKWKQGSS